MNKSKIIVSSLLLGSLLYAGGKGLEEANVSPLSIIVEDELYYSLGLKGGTLGVGIDFSIPITSSFALRLNANGFNLNPTITREEVEYATDIELLSAGILLDYYPTAENAFYLSAGIYYVDNKASAIGKGTNTTNLYKVGDEKYSAKKLGSLNASWKFENVAPYIGIGYGHKSTEKGWNFGVDIGLMYHGKSTVALQSIAGTSELMGDDLKDLEDEIEEERTNQKDDLDSFPFYPVLMLGMNYNF